jgi:serpin B
MCPSNIQSKIVSLSLLAVLLSVGCGQIAIKQVGPKKVDAETVALRKALPVVNKTQLKAVTDATNELSLAVLKAVIDENPTGNTVLSPLSLAQDFALVYESANGPTKTQIAKLLKVEGQSENALASFHSAFLSDMESDPYQTLSMANAIWIKDTYPVDPKVAQKLNALFGCSVQPLPADLGKAKSEMDAWVSKNTRGMIKETKTELSNAIYAMFLNALYFDGQWQKEFDPKFTENKPFASPTGKVSVSMMHLEDESVSASFDATQPGLRLPFLGERYSLIAIVPPDPKSLKNLIAKMNGKWFSEYRIGLSPSDVVLDLPKLDLSTSLSLEPTIKKLGGGAMFSPPLDLSTLVPKQGVDKDQFFISSVIQQARLKLDEKGVKAAAVTEVAVQTKSDHQEPKRISFDRPFLYFIVHKASGAIVLCGIVNDPTKS